MCGRPSSSNDMCHGTFYSTGGRTFNKVYGRVILDILMPFTALNQSILLMLMELASPMAVHVCTYTWSYAGGISETGSHLACPCVNGSTSNPPLFVANSYYCESGNKNRFYILITFSMLMIPFGMANTAA